jgi:hypothetical protein
LGAIDHRGIEREEREKLHFALKIHKKPKEKSRKEEN